MCKLFSDLIVALLDFKASMSSSPSVSGLTAKYS